MEKKLKLPTENDLEEDIESAYLEFDSRRKGHNSVWVNPQSEREAFKQVIRKLIRDNRNVSS